MSQELENRFFNFAIRSRDFCRKLKWDVINQQYIRQLIRSSSSVPANYIEASDDLGKADEKMKMKTSRREAKESILWLQLVIIQNDDQLEKERAYLIDEGAQIGKILSAIVKKLENR